MDVPGHGKHEQKGDELNRTGKIMTRVQICTVCGQNLWAITAVFLNIYYPGVLLLVSLLILLEMLTLKIGALNFGGYQSTSRNSPEEIKLQRK
jgi:hypothetical protein